MRHRVIALPVLLLLGACVERVPPASQGSPPPDEAQAKVAAFFTDVTDRWVENNPDQAVATGYFSGEKQNALERQLTPRTREYDLQRNAMAREVLAGLAAQDFTQATPTQQFAGELLKWQLDMLLTGEPFLDYIALPLNQFDGANVSLPNALTVVHPVQDVRDADNYVARLQLVDDRLREATADAAGRAQRGIVMPAFILRTTIAQMQQFIAPAAADNPLVTTLAAKTEALGDLTPEQRSVLLQSATATVADEIYPAWAAAIDELNRQLPLANDDAGLWRFPNGDAIYRRQLRAFTTTDLTPEQIH